MSTAVTGSEIRLRGRVQGVGLRPAVWRHAHELGLSGEVLNDAQGVLIRVAGSAGAIEDLVARLRESPPPLARIEHIERRAIAAPAARDFKILDAAPGEPRTQVAPDAALCADCAQDVLDPLSRRFRYPFTTCTHCGPRLSIVETIPYRREATTLAPFALCRECAAEYADPADRRFHAETIACHACGPRARLVRLDGRAFSVDALTTLDDVDAVCTLLQRGHIVALKGLGGYQLACDATQPAVVQRLRDAKRREAKPFALMARDLDVIRRYCAVDALEQLALVGRDAPIVLLRAAGPVTLPAAVAPGLRTLGFMLPTTPLHLLALRRMDRPVVMTSGNLAGEPQAIDDADALERLRAVADFALVHDRRIAVRVDDSVVRVAAGAARVLRRARGHAPAPIALPDGFAAAAPVLALGGELKAAFALLRDGAVVLSQHQGDLEDAATWDDYAGNLTRFEALFDHAPRVLAADLHPEYLSAKLARARAAAGGWPLHEVQHHHAHVAACLVENGRPRAAVPVLGVVLDGLGWGDDGSLWGGEFLLADYRSATRLGTFKPVALPGGAQAIREPWRALYAHLRAEMSWAELQMNFAGLEVIEDLARRPRAALDAMIAARVNAPAASSCGRLFDAVAAALGLCRDRQQYEGEAACRLEALVDPVPPEQDDELVYPFTIPNLRGSGLPYLEPLAMWRALLGDLVTGTPAAEIAGRFHRGLARAIAAMVERLAGSPRRFDTVALSGGCFHNAVLLADVQRRLLAAGFTVLTHRLVPAGDGGLALGQAAIAAARELAAREH